MFRAYDVISLGKCEEAFSKLQDSVQFIIKWSACIFQHNLILRHSSESTKKSLKGIHILAFVLVKRMILESYTPLRML